jgi:hypothetical protein
MGILELLNGQRSDEEMAVKGIVDLDNVVNDWMGWVMSQQTEVPKTAGLRSGKLEEMWPDLDDEGVDRIVEDVRGYIDSDLVPGAYDGLWSLLNTTGLKLMYVSAAPVDVEDARRVWFRKHGLPLEHENVLGLIHVGGSTEKTNWIMEYGCAYSFILDDSLSYLDAALLAEIPFRMAFNHPWNEFDENHDRVYSWAQVLPKLLSEFTELKYL